LAFSNNHSLTLYLKILKLISLTVPLMVTPMTLTLGMKWNILSVEKVPNIVLKIYTNCQKEPFHLRYVD
jgi:hypothetical protein